ncbi:hypothetical protein [Streptomyces ambofaciens]|jgi:hypothetical protein
MDVDTSERTMQLRLAAHISWAKTKDRSSRTAAARRASHHTRFLEMAREQYPDATEAELADIAASLKKAHYQALALKSAQARRIKRELAQKDKARRVQAELAKARSTPAA